MDSLVDDCKFCFQGGLVLDEFTNFTLVNWFLLISEFWLTTKWNLLDATTTTQMMLSRFHNMGEFSSKKIVGKFVCFVGQDVRCHQCPSCCEAVDHTDITRNVTNLACIKLRFFKTFQMLERVITVLRNIYAPVGPQYLKSYLMLNKVV